MRLAEKLFSEDALGDAVLARDDHDFVTATIQKPDRVESVGKQLQTLEAIEVADIFY